MNERYALAAEPREKYLGAGLWGRRDLVVLAVLYLLGAVGLVVAYYGSAAEAQWRDNAKWLVTAVGSVSLAGLGLLVWLVAGKVRIAAAQRDVRRGLLERSERRRSAAVLSLTGNVTAPGMRRYHRPSCLLMGSKPPVPVSDERTDLAPCGVCTP